MNFEVALKITLKGNVCVAVTIFMRISCMQESSQELSYCKHVREVPQIISKKASRIIVIIIY